MTAVRHYKLGRNEPKPLSFHPPSLMTLKSLTSAVPPASLDRSNINPNPQMYNNDKIGNCTSAMIANTMNAHAALQGFSVAVTNQNAVDFYSLSTGYDPKNPATDQGGELPAVLTCAATKGYPSLNYPYFPIWGTLQASNRAMIANTMNRIGSVGMGLALAEADQQVDQNGVFDITLPGNQTPGSWGGHAAVIWDYEGLRDTDIVRWLTWGGVYRATWRWIAARLFEAHGFAFHQLMTPLNKTYLGEDWTTLLSQNQALFNITTP